MIISYNRLMFLDIMTIEHILKLVLRVYISNCGANILVKIWYGFVTKEQVELVFVSDLATDTL